MLLADSNSSSIVDPVSQTIRETRKTNKLGSVISGEEAGNLEAQISERIQVQILDEAMSPDLLPFDVCIVDQRLQANDGDIVFARRNGGGGCIRRYKSQADGRGRNQFELIASNPSYPPYQKRPRDGVHIAGVVVGYRRTTQDKGRRKVAE